ncbi:MAG: DUF3618 domain-containing protein [Anaerolineae bacterium]|jgi:gas vesicle protein
MVERPDELTQRARHAFHGDPESPEEIREDIEDTRAEMSETVDALQERLSPERLRQEATITVREATIGRAEDMAERASKRARSFTSTLMDTVKSNPVPAALAGIGLGWLAMEYRSRPTGYTRYYETPRRYREEPRTYRTGERERYRGEARGRVEGMAEEARSRAEEVAEEARSRAQEMGAEARERVSEMADQAREEVEHLGEEAWERAERVGYEARRQARRARSEVMEAIEESPLAVGAVALALGAAAGLALPRTRQEEELFAPARERIMERAGEMIEQTSEKLEQVTQRVEEEVKEATEEEGLTT